MKDIANYLTTEPIHSASGGFHASEDADSLPTSTDHEKIEGAYYVWTSQELKDVIGGKEAEIASRYWNVQEGGNVERRFDAQGELIGKNTLCVQSETAEVAKQEGLSEEDVKHMLKSARDKLRAHREKHRPRPALDDKIVVSWNGLAIGGLARSSAALRSESPGVAKDYLSAAERAVDFIRTELYDKSTGTLRRVYREGPGETQGFSDDYAFLISGLIDLYEATFDDQYLQFADTLQQTQVSLFHDPRKHGFYSTPADQPDILIRVKDGMDNAEPSTNGVSASNFFRLSSLLNDESYEKMARKTVAAFEVEIGQHPGLFSGMMSSVVATKLGMKGLMLVGNGDAVDAALSKAAQTVRPNCTVLRVGSGAKSTWLKSRNELLRDLDGSKEMVQLCEGGVCKLLEAKDVGTLLGP